MDFFNDIDISERNLPHWHLDNAQYFVTCNLCDSLPKHVVAEIKEKKEIWLNTHKKPYSNEDIHEYYILFSNRIEELLNAGHGSSVLREFENSKIVDDALNYFNNRRYILDEWVVMPNHVHVIVKPLTHSLPSITHSWKSFTSNEINKRLHASGQLWMTESYDHIIRNETALEKIREYIRNNPSKANISVHHSSFLDK